mmetsp:Transcript_27992/g.47308  ORF Transcript_27992/g.47308 Transcript_27992/m.47308 type:complete len:94 (+) Transcript_27992:30-311(+)
MYTLYIISTALVTSRHFKNVVGKLLQQQIRIPIYGIIDKQNKTITTCGGDAVLARRQIHQMLENTEKKLPCTTFPLLAEKQRKKIVQSNQSIP